MNNAFPGLTVTDYCERVGAGFWAEPFNAITNLAFILVAMRLLRLVRRQQLHRGAIWDIWALVILIGVVGVGSFLWHTVATTWAQWLDVVPILIYMSIYLLSFLFRVARLSLIESTMWLFGFYAVHVALYLFISPHALNGSLFYLPSLALLVYFIRYDKHLGIAALFFAIGITFRSIDQLVCPVFAVGTHFLWHLAVSLSVFFTTRVLLLSAAQRQLTR